MSKKRKKQLKKWATMAVFYPIVVCGLVLTLEYAGNERAAAIAESVRANFF